MNRIIILLLWVAVCCLVCWSSGDAQNGITANGTLRPGIPAGGPGSSYTKAVPIYARDGASGVPSEYRYLSAHFPGSKPINHNREFYTDRMYDVLTFATVDGKTSRLIFDYRIHKD